MFLVFVKVLFGEDRVRMYVMMRRMRLWRKRKGGCEEEKTKMKKLAVVTVEVSESVEE